MRAMVSSGFHPAVLVRPVGAAMLLWLVLTVCQYDGPPVPLSPPPGLAMIGSPGAGTGWIDPQLNARQPGPSQSPAYLDRQRAAHSARCDVVYQCSTVQLPAICRVDAANANRERMKYCVALLYHSMFLAGVLTRSGHGPRLVRVGLHSCMDAAGDARDDANPHCDSESFCGLGA